MSILLPLLFCSITSGVINEIQMLPFNEQKIEFFSEYPVIINFLTIRDSSYYLGWSLNPGEFRVLELPDSAIERGDLIEVRYKKGGYPSVEEMKSEPLWFGKGISASKLVYEKGDMFEWIWYPDSTPTFGRENDDWGVVMGKVTDPYGDPMNARVVVWNYLVRYGTWTKLGDFILHLGKGKYWIEAQKQGYRMREFPKCILVGPNDTLKGINFELVPIESLEAESVYVSFSIRPVIAINFVRIRIALPAGYFITLKIYDASGRMIEIIEEKNYPPGYWEWIWNPSDILSGIYFVVLKIRNFIFARKVIILK